MKKSKISIVVIVVLLIALTVSVWQNISHVNKQNNARQLLMNQVHSCFRNVSLTLDGLIINLENGDTSDDTNNATILQICNYLVRADALLTQYRNYFPTPIMQYGSTFYSFEYIAYTLGGIGGEANGVRYNSVLQGNGISDKEIRYLAALRDDMVNACAAMESDESSPQEDKKLTISHLNTILDEFFDKWSPHNEDSPFFLLQSE